VKYSRLYAGSDGQSHFQDVDLSLTVPHGNAFRSDELTVPGAFFREASGTNNPKWQNASHRQFVIITSGAIDVMVGDGTTRRFIPGDILLAEDTTGRGHVTTAVDGKPWQAVFIRLD
jgi:hypothetical protein